MTHPAIAAIEWRPVLGHEGRYEVSSDGSVKSLLSRCPASGLLKPRLNHRGYLVVCLHAGDGTKSNRAVHRLVLEGFHGPRPAGKQAAHGDGNRENNHIENLRWASAKENTKDRIRHGRIQYGEQNHQAKLNRTMVSTIKRMKGAFTSYEVGILAGVHSSAIECIWRGETWKHVK